VLIAAVGLAAAGTATYLAWPSTAGNCFTRNGARICRYSP